MTGFLHVTPLLRLCRQIRGDRPERAIRFWQAYAADRHAVDRNAHLGRGRTARAWCLPLPVRAAIMDIVPTSVCTARHVPSTPVSKEAPMTISINQTAAPEAIGSVGPGLSETGAA